MKSKFFRLCLLVFIAGDGMAGELKVDINRDGKNSLSTTATGYTQWTTAGSGGTSSTGTSPITQSFNFTNNDSTVSIVTVSLAMTAAAQGAGGTGLTYTYYALGTTTAGWQLVSDGVTVNPAVANAGGQIQMTITGLGAGAHSLLTFHNAGDSPLALGTMAPIKVYLNGTYVTAITPSIRTNDLAAPTVYLNFTTASTSDVTTVLFAADTTSAATTKNVVLDGFEIDTPNSLHIANSPVPANGDEHVDADTGNLVLVWSPAIASNAVAHDVYFGTNQTAVKNATHASPEFQGNQVAANYPVAGLNSLLTYYWRVDEIDFLGNATPGAVWMFRTRHLAFPGAEGYGRFARGGRGGVVLEVTNLNDSGPGSYRAAIEASGPRTVVFRVSGLIRLQSPCIINNGYVTIAGQTAPGDGICFANWRAGMSGPNDVIMRFMRFRIGDAAQQSMDAMSPGSATHTIIDHCSSSWSLDVACNSLQSGSVGSQSAMTTYQKNIISEPLRYSYHYNDTLRAQGSNNVYQPHAFAASISGEIGSYHHNLIAHSTDRNWSLAGGYDKSVSYAGSLDIRNNVVYNWLARTTDGGVARCNYESNYYKPYPANNPVTFLLRLDPINTNNPTKPFYYMVGNVMEGKNYFNNNWQIGTAVPTGNGSNNYADANQVALAITNAEIFPSYVTTQTASNAYKVVLSDVGCSLPAQDLIDRRVVGEVLDGTTHYIGTNGPHYTINGYYQANSVGPDNPGLIDSQTDVHDYTNDATRANYSANYPWAPYATYNVPEDTDHDGMPDWWELLKGLNPDSAPGDFSDSNGDPDGDGYSNLEDYLNWLAAVHVDCVRNTNVDVDLTQFTRGFTNNSPAYVVSNPTNGTISLLAGGKVARFTPTANFHGLGSFQFKVTDASSFSYTNTIGVHVRALPASQLTIANSSPVPQLRFTGELGMYYLIQYSDDLRNWVTWTNTTATASPALFSVPGFPGPMARFYRTVSVQ
ncbi:MAG: T9SS C-terminal target domain-containing protein [Verrucomicrobiae bacterium]|nr:T9SS C-terminal target domain-containing protein [Verrucomicrobiae bacterium]